MQELEKTVRAQELEIHELKLRMQNSEHELEEALRLHGVITEDHGTRIQKRQMTFEQQSKQQDKKLEQQQIILQQQLETIAKLEAKLEQEAPSRPDWSSHPLVFDVPAVDELVAKVQRQLEEPVRTDAAVEYTQGDPLGVETHSERQLREVTESQMVKIRRIEMLEARCPSDALCPSPLTLFVCRRRSFTKITS